MNHWTRRITAYGEELLIYRNEIGDELASVNVEPYDNKYVVLFGGGAEPLDVERMQAFDDFDAAQAYVLSELEL